jgi:hypothetical protein
MALNKNVEITEEITRSKRAATATAAAAAVAAVAAAAMAKGNVSTWFPASLAGLVPHPLETLKFLELIHN